jgi:hypothetical protein
MPFIRFLGVVIVAKDAPLSFLIHSLQSENILQTLALLVAALCDVYKTDS